MGHTAPEQAGKVFERIRPRLAVFTHVAVFTLDAGRPPPRVEDITARARTTYGGPLVVGDDLMAIVIGDEVAVRRHDGSGAAVSSPNTPATGASR